MEGDERKERCLRPALNEREGRRGIKGGKEGEGERVGGRRLSGKRESKAGWRGKGGREKERNESVKNIVARRKE